MQPAKIGGRASASLPSRQPSHVARAFGVDTGAARITCSLQSDIREVASKCVDAAKLAGFALATSALLVSVSKLPACLIPICYVLAGGFSLLKFKIYQRS